MYEGIHQDLSEDLLHGFVVRSEKSYRYMDVLNRMLKFGDMSIFFYSNSVGPHCNCAYIRKFREALQFVENTLGIFSLTSSNQRPPTDIGEQCNTANELRT
jgi:hypothetical protein